MTELEFEMECIDIGFLGMMVEILCDEWGLHELNWAVLMMSRILSVTTSEV